VSIEVVEKEERKQKVVRDIEQNTKNAARATQEEQ